MNRRFITVPAIILAWFQMAVVASAADPPKTDSKSAGTTHHVAAMSAKQVKALQDRLKKTGVHTSAIDVKTLGANTGLSVDGISNLLNTMGYEPKLSTGDDGSKWIDVTVVRGDWNIDETITLSPDGSNLWATVYFGDVKNPDKLSADLPLKLLNSNANVWPAYFYYDLDSKTLSLQQALSNDQLKAAP